MKFSKKFPITFIVISMVATLITVGFVLFLKSGQKIELSSEEKELQSYSAQMGKNKFDLTGQVVAVLDQTLTVKATSVSQTIAQSKDKEIKLMVEGFAPIFDQEEKIINLSDLKTQDKVDVKGTFSGDNLTAEYIARQ